MNRLVARGVLLALAGASTACAAAPGRVAREVVQQAQAVPAGMVREPPTDEELARQLANPLSDLPRVGLRLDHDDDVGSVPGDRERWTLDVLPVVPFPLSGDSLLISRTVLPIVSQEDVALDEDAGGLGDLVQTFYFTSEPKAGARWVLGAGPVLVVPTATDDALGTEKWSAGPAVAAVRQGDAWTYGMLLEHVWSFAGDDSRAGVNSTFLQPFVAYTSSSALTLTLDAEGTYDWSEEGLALPVNLEASKVVSLGELRLAVGGGVRWWVEDTDASPEGLGFRLSATPVFPR